jgi:hypothetical protein
VQTGVRLDTLKQHYERWWPRDQEQIGATYATLDPSLREPGRAKLVPRFGTNCGKYLMLRH